MSEGFRLHLDDEAASVEAGRRMGRAIAGAALLVGLAGPLGAGKSTLARAALRELGVRGAIPSPSYTLVEPYETVHGPAWHVDLYRLHGAADVRELGLDDLLERGPVLVEWPERAEGALPEPDLEVRLAHAGRGRDLAVRGRTARGIEAERRWSAEA